MIKTRKRLETAVRLEPDNEEYAGAHEALGKNGGSLKKVKENRISAGAYARTYVALRRANVARKAHVRQFARVAAVDLL